MSDVGIALLGPLAVRGTTGGLSPRDRVVLAALAMCPGQVAGADRLADALWGDSPPASSHKIVPGCIMRLRRVLGAGAIETTPQGYRLTLPPDEVDAQRFQRLLRQGREFMTLGESERAVYVLDEALELWRGQPLGDLEEWEPGRIEADRLVELRLDAQEARLEAAVHAGRHGEVLAEAQAQVAHAPLRERRWALLALAQYQAGRQGEALQTLQRARRLLNGELGLDPSAELVDLERAILRQDPDLVSSTAPGAPAATCPFLGLVPYGIEDADAFFGRDTEIAQCLDRLRTAGVVVVTGPSGSGKSSLVRAGVAAGFAVTGPRPVVINPGPRPLDAWADAAPTPGGLLVVDQAEELFTLTADPAERQQFFDRLLAHCDRGKLVVALRADRLGDLAEHPAFARLAERNLYLLGPMTEAALRSAIEGPARQAGLLLEPGLVDLLARDVEGQPGALPLLSHALRRTWEHREGRTLTVAGYRRGGGVRESVARSAEQLYLSLTGAQQDQLRHLLLRLVSATEDTEAVRSRVPRHSLAGDPDRDRLLDALAAARLITTDGDSVQLAHECLARAWPRLRGWLDDDVDGRRILRHLSSTALTWQAMGRPASELYRGVRLTRALAWAERSEPDLTPTERAFLASSREAERAAERVARGTARQRARTRWLTVGIAVLAVIALVAGLVAVRARQNLDAEALAADSRRLLAAADESPDAGRALLLAVAAVRLLDDEQTRTGLLRILSRHGPLVGTARTAPVVTLAARPDGSELVAGGGDRLTFFDTDPLQENRSQPVNLARSEFRSDGQQLALAADPLGAPSFGESAQQLPLFLFGPDGRSGQRVGPTYDGVAIATVWDLDYSADGRLLAVEVDIGDSQWLPVEATIEFWSTSNPVERVQRIPVALYTWAIALSPSGDRLYVGTADRTVDVYDVAGGQQVGAVELAFDTDLGEPGDLGLSDGLAVSPDGRTLAVVHNDEVVLIATDSLARRQVLPAHAGFMQAIEFSPDGRLVATGTAEGMVTVWDVGAGVPLEFLRGHSAEVTGLAFGPAGDTLYSGSADGTILEWDLAGDRRWLPRTPPQAGPPLGAVAVPSPDGRRVLFADRYGSPAVRFLDLDGVGLSSPVADPGGQRKVAWHPGSTRAVTTGAGSVRVWDASGGLPVGTQRLTEAEVSAVAYTADGGRIVAGTTAGEIVDVDAATLAVGPARASVGAGVRVVTPLPDGRRAAALLDDGALVIVDLTDGRVSDRFPLDARATSAAVSPDGERMVIGGADGTVGLVAVGSGEWIRAPADPGHPQYVTSSAFSADGQQIVTSSFDGTVRLWDGRTGAARTALDPTPKEDPAFAVFTPDAGSVLIATPDGSVARWDLGAATWIDRACVLAGRNLTEPEWTELIGDRPYRTVCP